MWCFFLGEKKKYIYIYNFIFDFQQSDFDVSGCGFLWIYPVEFAELVALLNLSFSPNLGSSVSLLPQTFLCTNFFFSLSGTPMRLRLDVLTLSNMCLKLYSFFLSFLFSLWFRLKISVDLPLRFFPLSSPFCYQISSVNFLLLLLYFQL